MRELSTRTFKWKWCPVFIISLLIDARRGSPPLPAFPAWCSSRVSARLRLPAGRWVKKKESGMKMRAWSLLSLIRIRDLRFRLVSEGAWGAGKLSSRYQQMPWAKTCTLGGRERISAPLLYHDVSGQRLFAAVVQTTRLVINSCIVFINSKTVFFF